MIGPLSEVDARREVEELCPVPYGDVAVDDRGGSLPAESTSSLDNKEAREAAGACGVEVGNDSCEELHGKSPASPIERE